MSRLTIKDPPNDSTCLFIVLDFRLNGNNRSRFEYSSMWSHSNWITSIIPHVQEEYKDNNISAVLPCFCFIYLPWMEDAPKDDLISWVKGDEARTIIRWWSFSFVTLLSLSICPSFYWLVSPMFFHSFQFICLLFLCCFAKWNCVWFLIHRVRIRALATVPWFVCPAIYQTWIRFNFLCIPCIRHW